MFVDLIQQGLNLLLLLFLLRMAQVKLIDRDSDFGKALAFLLH